MILLQLPTLRVGVGHIGGASFRAETKTVQARMPVLPRPGVQALGRASSISVVPEVPVKEMEKGMIRAERVQNMAESTTIVTNLQ